MEAGANEKLSSLTVCFESNTARMNLQYVDSMTQILLIKGTGAFLFLGTILKGKPFFLLSPP